MSRRRASALALLIMACSLLAVARAVSPKDDDAFIGWQGESYKPMNPRTTVCRGAYVWACERAGERGAAWRDDVPPRLTPASTCSPSPSSSAQPTQPDPKDPNAPW